VEMARGVYIVIIMGMVRWVYRHYYGHSQWILSLLWS
jgi:hypothetical protein